MTDLYVIEESGFTEGGGVDTIAICRTRDDADAIVAEVKASRGGFCERVGVYGRDFDTPRREAERTTPDRWDAEAREWVSVEPDGKGWRVALVVGHQRSTVIALSDQDACEAYARWLRANIFVPLARRAHGAGYRLGLETAAEIAAQDARECPDHPLHSDAHDWCWSALAIEAAIRCEIEKSS